MCISAQILGGGATIYQGEESQFLEGQTGMQLDFSIY